MNRSILIVICDFLVLAAMSLSTGVSESAALQKGGVVPKIVALDAHVERMKAELRKRARLKMEKDEAEKQLAELRRALDSLGGDFRKHAMKLDETSRELSNTRSALEKREQLLKEKDEALRLREEALASVRTELADVSGKYETASRALARSKEEIGQKESELKQSKSRTAALGSELKTMEGRLRDAELGLSYTKGSLNRAEKELADTKVKMEASAKALYEKGIELEYARRELSGLKKNLNSAVQDLNRTQGELDRTRTDLAKSGSELAATRATLVKTAEESKKTAADLADTRKRLSDTEELLRSDALTKYSKAAVHLLFRLKNERLMNDFALNENLYPPEIEIAGKVYLPGSFKALTGLLKQYAGYTKIAELSYSVKKPESSFPFVRLKGPIRSLKDEPRACLIELEKPLGVPLKALTYEELKKRGLQDLTLFKFGSFGRETASLNGRCSITLSHDDSYLYIRNSMRNSSELAASIGDFVITKEGQFVGIVVSTAEKELGAKEEALCFLFPASVDLKEAFALPLDKKEDARYYTAFTQALQTLQRIVTELDRGHTPGK